MNRTEYTLKHRESEVHLQPKVGLGDLEFTGTETLVRRQHEGGRIIPSGELGMFQEMGCGSGQGHYFSRPLPMSVSLERYYRKTIDKL